ncbi:MAG: hypothetical protein JWM88_1042 [Verrucomicrobia bacterium]|nr:hypothetical protein [Verrucomicrobiota bacterium]
MKPRSLFSTGVVLILAVTQPRLAAQSARPAAGVTPAEVAKQARAALAQHTGTLTLRGLGQPVEVIRDKWGVPHIYAQSTHDLFFAQGYVAAQDHLWQMEIWRRTSEGTLAEVLGPDYIERDRFARTVMFRGDWTAELKKYGPEVPEILAAFSEGVNEAIGVAIEESRVPVEFTLAGFLPQAVWNPKTLLTRLPAWRKAALPVDPKAAPVNLPEKATPVDDAWVIGGKKSATGLPLVVSGVQIELAGAAPRYLVHLVAPDWNVIGIAEPGLPGISAGHNENVAWASCEPASGQPDVVSMEVDPANAHRGLVDGQWRDLVVTRELIQVKGRRTNPEVVEIRRTPDGPVVGDDKEHQRVSVLRWPALAEGGAPAPAALGAIQTKDSRDFIRSVGKFPSAPARGFVYADRAGNFGTAMGGPAAAPATVTGSESFHALTGGKGNASRRVERINNVLRQDRTFTVDEVERLQGDEVSLSARELLPLLQSAKSIRLPVQESVDRLRAWDGVVSHDSIAAAIFEYWTRNLNAPSDASPADRAQRALPALEQALLEMEEKFGADRTRWTWGDLHRATYVPFLPAPSAAALATIPAVGRGGDGSTVRLTGNSGPSGAAVEADTSAMLVMDVHEWDRSMALNAPGNESQLGGRHYADLLPLWAAGNYFPLNYTRPQVDAAAEARLVLFPGREFEAEETGAAFRRVQTDLFTAHTPVTVVWGDYDNDGWPDLFVGYQEHQASLFHNEKGRFVEVGEAGGIADVNSIRSAAWGDFDGDGNLDLYIGFGANSTAPNRLYRGDGKGHFVDVAREWGISDWGESRQISFVDFNNDGRVDLFVGFRDRANRLYRNEGDHFTEVSAAMGIKGPQSTVNAVWFDFNEDGRLDLFLANQSGSLNRVYRNDGDHFTDVAGSVGMSGEGRTSILGSVGIAIGDYNGDGRLDLYFANYGPSWLMRNDGGGRFTDVAPAMGVVLNQHLVAAGWGDYDNDGRPDLYACGYLLGHPQVRDYLLRNEGDRFTDVTPGYMLKHDSDHGVAWADYDRDGAIDLALCDHESTGVVSIYHNELPAAKAARSLQVLVVDANGHYTKAGSEVRVYSAGTRKVLGAGLVDTGSGYSSQSMLPLHFGLPVGGKVDVEVTTMSNSGRKVTRVEGVAPASLPGHYLIIKTNP